MEKCLWSFHMMLAIAVLVLGSMVSEGSGQISTSCVNQLMPCLNFLNGTKDVPSNCCDPLKRVVESDPQCLCRMMSNQGAEQAQQAGINNTEAQQLPGRCGLRLNPISCLTNTVGSGKNNKESDYNSASGLLLPATWSIVLIGMLHIIV
ncbi:hypothetical protein K2173_028202 [Erythroxylum novogranatense]|uniref:Bifunctional inhibitor/plant lipid transfer protein/seed storage helical domain-containing protein n=1 Tax=Erythroxylum novogranatense TaxID=1862640 RepID=A0AAV8U4W7_9ROSI|nr:hypothetical protein K2173_028202 [Erythroxylum novogranatense]